MTGDIDGAVDLIDFVIVGFPVGSTDFDHELAREVKALSAAEFIRVLDVLVVHKDDVGQVELFEVEQLGASGSFAGLEGQLPVILAEERVLELARMMQNGTTAGVLVWENTWSSELVDAARASGAQVIASGRIDHRAIVDSDTAAPGCI